MAGQVKIYDTFENARNLNKNSNNEDFPNLFLNLPKDETQEKNLKEWFTDLCKKIQILKGIKVEFDQAKAIFAELEKSNYGLEQRKLAELYILQGDWKYHVKKIIIDDFFPSEENLKQFEGVNYHFDSAHEILQDARKYGLGIAKLKFKEYVESFHLEQKFQQLEYNSNLNTSIGKAGLFQMQLNLKSDEIIAKDKKIYKLEAEIANLKERIEKLENDF